MQKSKKIEEFLPYIKNITNPISIEEKEKFMQLYSDGQLENAYDGLESLKNKIPITDIHLTKNKGKGYAMAIGIEKALNDIIVFIDADLLNLQEDHLDQLITPVLYKKAEMEKKWRKMK